MLRGIKIFRFVTKGHSNRYSADELNLRNLKNSNFLLKVPAIKTNMKNAKPSDRRIECFT
jgi:hypothetical protein